VSLFYMSNPNGR